MAEDKNEDIDKDKEVRKELKEISEKMASLEYTMGEISKPYGDMLQYMDRLKTITEGYFRIIDLYRAHGRVSPDLLLPEVKDPISREIINILFEKPELNISQIADILKERKGSASRKTVREKLAFLEEISAIEVIQDRKTRKFRISEEMSERWLKVLGLME
jgi:DNA-binding transcriptional ArsR family regulator